jgi:hypothetical protein
MAEPKEAKITKTDPRVVAGTEEGLVGSVLSRGVDLAERAASTAFGIVRDVRGETNQRILGTLKWVEEFQEAAFRLVRSIDERLDRLVVDAIDTGEGITLGIIRTVGETGHGVTEMAGSLTRPSREVQRAA